MAHDHDHAHCEHDHDHAHHHGHGPGGAEGPSVTAVLEDLGQCRKLLKVEVPSTEVEKEISTRIKQLAKNVHLKGFRRGKAPRSRIEALYGDSVRQDARDHLLRAGYMKALEEQLGMDKILGEGTIENVAFSLEEGLKFEVTLHTRPEFTLPEYKGLELSVDKALVRDEDLDKALEDFRRSRGELKPVEDPEAVVEGEDLLEVNVEAWLADEYETFAQAQDGGEAPEGELKPLKTEEGLRVQLPLDFLGGYKVEDLADSLQGLKVGEYGEVETDLPEDYEVIEGRNEPAMLRVQVKAIQRVFLPELNEAWVKEAGFGSVEDLKRELRDGLQQRVELRQRHALEEKAIAKLMHEVGNFDLPTELVEKEIQSAERRRLFELRIQEGKTEEEAKEAVEAERSEIGAEVERMLRTFFVLDEIAKREDLSVSEADVEARINRLAAARGENPRKVREELEQHRVMPQLRHELMDEKTRSFIRSHAKVTEEDL